MFVYVLKSLKDDKYYIGISNNPEKRLAERHNLGLVKSTKNRRPFILVYKERFINLKTARNREITLKRMKGGIQFKQILEKAVVVQQ